MLPELPISYPAFVADQLLTAKNLNDLFIYLDEQERGTRINLIGIGIVCGLELIINPSGTSITITKGCGITSEGYLVRWDEATFENYKAYDAAKEIVYSPFFGDGKPRFDIDELKSNASEEGILKLSTEYLKGKVVLLFVELISLEAKNCDPESCDDKGKNTTLTIRPLIVDQKAAALLNGGLTGGSAFGTSWAGLPAIKMPRHHLPATEINDAGDVFAGFQKVMSVAFFKQLQSELSQVYSRLSPLVKDIYPSNPFSTILADFAFINDGSLTATQLLYMQYYYDLFSDIIYAYEELRHSGMELLSLCCPDENAFPRHLLLGSIANTSGALKPDSRQHFIPSPAVCCHGDKVTKLRVLFKRLVLLLEKFEVENAREFSSSFIDLKNVAALRRSGNTVPIRITPSKYGDIPLSKKSIPFYYDAATGVDKLFQYWNYELSRTGGASQNLSYQADSWAGKNDSVVNPLNYDLEPYNFLRIEGHVGHSYVEALSSINKIRDSKRLPFDTIALSADIVTLREQMAAIANSKNNAGLTGSVETDLSMNCHFQDLEALYNTQVQELLCKLCKEMKYFYEPPVSNLDAAFDQTPKVPLLAKCDGTFRYQLGSQGDLFERFWQSVATKDYLSPDQIINANVKQVTTHLVKGNTPIDSLFNALLYYIEKISEILPTELKSFDIVAFLRRYTDLVSVAQAMKDYAVAAQESKSNDQENPESIEEAMNIEDIIDHLDALIYACKDAHFSALYNDYKTRWVYLAMLQKLGYYAKMHPEIQHKAGVPIGGTFILVYHERQKAKKAGLEIFTKQNRVTVEKKAVEVIDKGQVLESIKDSKGVPDATKEKVASDAKAKIVEDKKAATDAVADGSNKGAAKADLTENIVVTARDNKQTFNRKDFNSPIVDRIYKLDIKKLSAQLTKNQYAIIDKLFFRPQVAQNDLDELTAVLPDKVVIADFFLPYMCCSDCPPVYFIVNESNEPDPVAPTISLKPSQFCSGDKTDYTITVTPATTTVSGEGVTAVEGGFVFNPSNINLDASLNKTVKLTATNDDQTATQSVVVFAKPVANFEVIPGSTYNLFVFNNLSQNGSDAVWDFGDGITAKGDNPSHIFEKDTSYVVTLTVTNGICSDTVNKTINVAKASISIDGKQFCIADKKSYPVSVFPTGGKLQGEGTTTNSDGLFFEPTKVAIDAGSANKVVSVSYSFDNQTVGLNLTVFNMPSAAFSVKDVQTAANVKSFGTTNKFAASYFWDFGDGSSSVEANPLHQYKQAGSYVVTLQVTNGICVANSSQTINIVQVSISLKPDTFCSIDQQPYTIAVSPTGGKLAGEGVSDTGSGGTFTPALVKLGAKQASKDVLISYESGNQTAQIHATVFQTPDGKFTVTPATNSPLARTFSPSVAFPAVANWDFGDGEQATEFSPTHTFKKAGQYTVTLKLTNGQCSASSKQVINVNVEVQPPKDCGTLNNFLNAYQKLESINPNQYKGFTATFSAFKEVDGFFSKLGQFATSNSAKQLDFLSEFGFANKLSSWLKILNDLVSNSDVPQIAFALLKILTDLAMYAECVQDLDMTDEKNKVVLNIPFTQLSKMISSWGSFVKGADGTTLKMLQALQADVNNAINQVNGSNEATVKKNYLSVLNAISKTLTGLLKK